MSFTCILVIKSTLYVIQMSNVVQCVFHTLNNIWVFIVRHVICSTLSIHKEVDVGLVVVGDLQRKSKFINLRLGEVVSGLIQWRNTQLNIMHYGLGLEDPHMTLHHMWKSLKLCVGEFQFVPM